MPALEDVYNNAFNNVLYDPKYNLLQKKSINVWEIIKNLIIEILRKIFDFFDVQINFDDNGSADILMRFFMALAIIVLIVAVFILIRKRAKRKRNGKTMDDIFNELRLKKLTVYDLINSANEYKTSGDIRQCLHYRFAAVLWLLNQKNIIKGFDTKTNYQIQMELNRSNMDINEKYSLLNNGFNKAWYGYKNLDSHEFEKWESTFNDLVSVLTEEENEKAI